MFQRKYDEHNFDIDETIVPELLEHDNLRVLGFKILEKSEKVIHTHFVHTKVNSLKTVYFQI